jgi:hypothetical protein
MQKAQFAIGLLVLAAVMVATSRPPVELVSSRPAAVLAPVSLPAAVEQSDRAPEIDAKIELSHSFADAATRP